MQSLNTRKEHRTVIENSHVGNTDAVSMDEVKFADNLLACQAGQHGSIVWSKDSKGNTIVYCDDCHATIYDGKELNMETLGLVRRTV